PLSVILGYASFLQEEESEEVSAHAGKVMQSALQLRRIIEDMVNLRYLKQSQSELKRENVPVSELLKDLQHDVISITGAKDHHLTIDTGCEVELNVDRSRIVMALTNVLNNALRFTPAGGSITVRAQKQSDQEVWISVIDTGIGIEAQYSVQILDVYYQLEDHLTRHDGGLRM